MIRTALMATAAVALFAGVAMAQPAPGAAPAAPPPGPPDYSKVVIKVTDLGHRTWELEGQGGNITVAAGDDGVIMVDSEFAPLHDKIKAAIAGLSPQPIKYLVNTHFHGDHTGGNEAFAKDGVVVVAHPNVGKRLAAGSVNLAGQRTPPAPQGAIPTKVYQSELTLTVKGRKAELKHPAPAHTDGDTWVWFADANVIATGDIVSLGARYPNVDVASGGNINGIIAAVDTYIARADASTKVVPGHGPVIDRAGLQQYRAMLVANRDAVAKLIAAVKSEDEAIAAKPTAESDAKLGVAPNAGANFTRQIYRSLKPPAA